MFWSSFYTSIVCLAALLVIHPLPPWAESWWFWARIDSWPQPAHWLEGGQGRSNDSWFPTVSKNPWRSRCRIVSRYLIPKLWDPIPTNDVSPAKTSHIILHDGGQGFRFYQFSEIVYTNYKKLQLSRCYWEWTHDVESPLSEWPLGCHQGQFFCQFSDDIAESLAFVIGFDISLGVLLHSMLVVSNSNQFVNQPLRPWVVSADPFMDFSHDIVCLFRA